jgi:hypothetical protein
VTPRKGIRRIIHPGSRTKGWKVTIRRASGEVEKLFSDGVYGGRLSAYRAASAYYEEMLPHFPLASRIGKMTTVRCNNRSGISGVYRWPANGEGRPNAYWAAQWVSIEDNRTLRRKFSIAHYGEIQSKKLAAQTRREALKKLVS